MLLQKRMTVGSLTPDARVDINVRVEVAASAAAGTLFGNRVEALLKDAGYYDGKKPLAQ